MGPKREEVLTAKEKAMTAYHEAGHALLAWILPGADRVHKVTIIPRGRALGVTQLLPEEDRMNIGESELHSRLIFMLGGRAAEKLVFDEYSAGAEDDLKQATQLARRMVTHWGMSERSARSPSAAARSIPSSARRSTSSASSASTRAQLIDEEVARILHAAADRAHELLSEQSRQARPAVQGAGGAGGARRSRDRGDHRPLAAHQPFQRPARAPQAAARSRAAGISWSPGFSLMPAANRRSSLAAVVSFHCTPLPPCAMKRPV